MQAFLTGGWAAEPLGASAAILFWSYVEMQKKKSLYYLYKIMFEIFLQKYKITQTIYYIYLYIVYKL